MSRLWHGVHISEFRDMYASVFAGCLASTNSESMLVIPQVPTAGSVVTYNQRQETISRLAIEIGVLNTSPWTPYHWSLVLPQVQLPSEFQQIVLLPLRAISVAFKALRSDDEALRRQAFEYYAKGLVQQRCQLNLLKTNQLQASTDVILWLLLMALLLLEFELMAPLSRTSWLGHALGSADLLALLSPSMCQTSPFFEIFWQLRFTMVLLSLGNQSRFTS